MRSGLESETWCSPNPEEAALLMASVQAPWWFAGGWAIDLFLGRSHRSHADLDLGCFRRDQGEVLKRFAGWDIRSAAHGELTPLEGVAVADPAVHGLWCRPKGNACWVLEILLEDSDGSDWIYRRDRRIRRAAEHVTRWTNTGLPYLRAEIQLLYKSKNPRPRDHADFDAAWPFLNDDAKTWLIAQLAMMSPGHDWLRVARRG